MDLTNTDAHWLAGLLEGEGSFMKGPPSSPNLPIVKVEMCDEDVIHHAAHLLNASVTIIDRYPERGYKRVFRITLKGSRAVQLMLGLRPLMGDRRSRDIGSALATLLLSSPAFAQFGGDRVTSFLSSALSYAQGLGIFGAGFLVIWAVANIARERPSGKQWAGAGGALLLSSVLQLLRTFAG